MRTTWEPLSFGCPSVSYLIIKGQTASATLIKGIKTWQELLTAALACDHLCYVNGRLSTKLMHDCLLDDVLTACLCHHFYHHSLKETHLTKASLRGVFFNHALTHLYWAFFNESTSLSINFRRLDLNSESTFSRLRSLAFPFRPFYSFDALDIRNSPTPVAELFIFFIHKTCVLNWPYS